MKNILSSRRTVLLLFILLTGCLCTATLHSSEMETVTFRSADGITVSADLYMAHPVDAPFIILFHQAGWSRGEYLEIAPKLNKMGFNCMAVDQRSGGSVNDVANLTKPEAEKAGKQTRYIDALPDMEAAIEFVKGKYPESRLILWGSSYSAALVLKLAGDRTEEVDGVLSFSPGEYFEGVAGADFITRSARNITASVFVTSAGNEGGQWQDIFAAIRSPNKISFLPETAGNHGSRALWSRSMDHKDYWDRVELFLKTYFPIH